MASDLLVVMGASCTAGSMPVYLKQLEDAKIDYYVKPLNPSDVGGSGGDLAYKVRTIREFANQFNYYERIVMTDAFDVTLFCDDRDRLIQRIPTDHVLWAAEKNCYPDPSIADKIPDRGLHRFANGGMLCGSPASLLDWCARAEVHPMYVCNGLDQYFYNLLLSANDPLMVIDHQTELFFCLFRGYPELEFEKGYPVNTTYGTRPSFIHANGHAGTEGMWESHKKSLS